MEERELLVFPTSCPRGKGAHQLGDHAHPVGTADMVSRDRTQSRRPWLEPHFALWELREPQEVSRTSLGLW